MISVEVVETIDRAIDDVFEQLVDIDRYPEWMPGDGLFLTCTKDSEGAVGRGTEYTDRTRVGVMHGEVYAFEPPTRVVFRYEARLLSYKVMEGYPGYTLQRVGDMKTRVHHLAEGHLYGPMRLLGPLVQRIARGERERTVQALKRSLESVTDVPGE